MGVQRVAFETRRHRQNAAAHSRRAGDRRKKAERLGVGPMDVLDRDEQRLAVGRSLHQFDDDALLALRPGRRIHRFVQSARRLRLGNLKQIAQIERVIGVQHQLPHGRLDRALDNVGRRARTQADKPRHDCADSAVSAFGPEIENEARMRPHARCRSGRLQLVHQPCLADAGLAANQDDGPRRSVDACVEDGAELSHLRATAN